MTRRRLLACLLFALLALPLAAVAQPKKHPRVGYLSGSSSGDPARDGAFREGLQAFGYVDGQTITLESRFADGRHDRLATFAAELVRAGVDLIVTSSTPATLEAQRATRTIPIVMALSAYEAGSPGITSLARPGGNVTGLTTSQTEIGPKRLELLKEALPRMTRVGVLQNMRNPSHPAQLKAIEEAGRKLGVKTQALEIKTPDDIDRVLASTAQHLGAIMELPDSMFVVRRVQLVKLAATHRLATMFLSREYADAGCLMVYGPDIAEMHRRAAGYVDQILKGAKPGDLPIQQPTKFDLVVNMRTAKALGLTIPPAVLLRADDVIE